MLALFPFKLIDDLFIVLWFHLHILRFSSPTGQTAYALVLRHGFPPSRIQQYGRKSKKCRPKLHCELADSDPKVLNSQKVNRGIQINSLVYYASLCVRLLGALVIKSPSRNLCAVVGTADFGRRVTWKNALAAQPLVCVSHKRTARHSHIIFIYCAARCKFMAVLINLRR